VPKLALLPIGLVVLAGLGDAAGTHRLAFWLLVLAVPGAAVAALVTLDEALCAEPARPLRYAWLQALSLALILTGAAVRAPVHDGAVPRLAVSALVACLIVYALQGLALLAPALRPRPSLRFPNRV
jgi:hypothetical protein